MLINDRIIAMDQLSNVFEKYIDINESGPFAGRFGLSKQAPDEAKVAFEEWKRLSHEQKEEESKLPFDF